MLATHGLGEGAGSQGRGICALRVTAMLRALPNDPRQTTLKSLNSRRVAPVAIHFCVEV